MQKITPFLWFDGQAEEAINLYTSVFKTQRSSILKSGAKARRFRRTR
jgi:predicted 3-demethylubiquinone-9 3-methyltransferase (glyoxalase superfamily)